MGSEGRGRNEDDEKLSFLKFPFIKIIPCMYPFPGWVQEGKEKKVFTWIECIDWRLETGVFLGWDIRTMG